MGSGFVSDARSRFHSTVMVYSLSMVRYCDDIFEVKILLLLDDVVYSLIRKGLSNIKHGVIIQTTILLGG